MDTRARSGAKEGYEGTKGLAWTLAPCPEAVIEDVLWWPPSSRTIDPRSPGSFWADLRNVLRALGFSSVSSKDIGQTWMVVVICSEVVPLGMCAIGNDVSRHTIVDDDSSRLAEGGREGTR